VAVAVERSRSLVLDADYRIVEIGSALEDGYAHVQGHVLWDVESELRPLLQPSFEKAWRTGEAVEFVVFFGGRLVEVDAHVVRDRLRVSWEILHRLDVLTLDRLKASLEEAMAIMDGVARPRSRPQLRAVEGGATTLAESLRRIEAELAARESSRRGRPAPASLRALP
jgi:hypothetical protein